MTDCPRCQGTGEIVTNWRVHLEDDVTGDEGVAECPDCNGTGDDEYDPPCTDCGGTGFKYQTERVCTCTLTDEERRAWQETREGMNR